MSLVALPRFWLAFVLTFLGLSGSGAGLAWILVPQPPAYYRTSYFEFPLPADWVCDREGTETLCRPGGAARTRAIIILTAKWRGPDDTREAYLAHLQKTQPLQTDDGRTVTSEVLEAGEHIIGNYRWVDGRHMNGELENYITRYLATTTAEIAVLVTYSIHRDALDIYDPALNATVEGLRIFQSPVR